MYNNVAKDISHAFEFMASCTKTPARLEGANKLFTSHEGLVLEYEEAMTREVDGRYFNLGAHMLWIGDRTRDVDGAHIEYVKPTIARASSVSPHFSPFALRKHSCTHTHTHHHHHHALN